MNNLKINLYNLLEVFLDALFFRNTRTNRLQFFIQFILYSLIFEITLSAAIVFNLSWIFVVLNAIISLYCYFMIVSKRSYDLGKGKGFRIFSVIAILPPLCIALPFLFIYLLLAKGNQGENSYGDPVDVEKSKPYNKYLIICTVISAIIYIIIPHGDLNYYFDQQFPEEEISDSAEFDVEEHTQDISVNIEETKISKSLDFNEKSEPAKQP